MYELRSQVRIFRTGDIPLARGADVGVAVARRVEQPVLVEIGHAGLLERRRVGSRQRGRDLLPVEGCQQPGVGVGVAGGFTPSCTAPAALAATAATTIVASSRATATSSAASALTIVVAVATTFSAAASTATAPAAPATACRHTPDSCTDLLDGWRIGRSIPLSLAPGSVDPLPAPLRSPTQDLASGGLRLHARALEPSPRRLEGAHRSGHGLGGRGGAKVRSGSGNLSAAGRTRGGPVGGIPFGRNVGEGWLPT